MARQMFPLVFVAIFAFNISLVTARNALNDREKRSDDSGPLEAVISQLSQTVTTLNAKLQAAETLINTLQADLSSLRSDSNTRITNIQTDTDAKVANLNTTKGSTYVRWGKTQCPATASTIYSGVAGGGFYAHSGTGANRVCMVMNPVIDNGPFLSNGYGSIYGAQYYIPGHVATDVTCSLCYTTYSTTFLVPGTNRCPDGTTEQYHGYLTVGDQRHAGASEYLCVDSNPDDRPGSSDDRECAFFDQTLVICGSLPCPPYVDNKPATCAVCSK